VGVCEGVSVGVTVGVWVTVPVWVGVCDGVAVPVCVGVFVGDDVSVGDAVGVAVGVSVTVPVGVSVGVCVGVSVGAAVAVAVSATHGPVPDAHCPDATKTCPHVMQEPPLAQKLAQRPSVFPPGLSVSHSATPHPGAPHAGQKQQVWAVATRDPPTVSTTNTANGTTTDNRFTTIMAFPLRALPFTIPIVQDKIWAA